MERFMGVQVVLNVICIYHVLSMAINQTKASKLSHPICNKQTDYL